MILTCNHCGRRIGRSTEQDNHHGCSHCAEFSEVQTRDSERKQQHETTSAAQLSYRQTA